MTFFFKCAYTQCESVLVVLLVGIMIRMQLATFSVNEDVDSGSVSVCAEVAVGVLQTDLTVTLSTTNGTKAGLQ